MREVKEKGSRHISTKLIHLRHNQVAVVAQKSLVGNGLETCIGE